MPPPRTPSNLKPGWFDCLADVALVREFRLLSDPNNLSPLVDVSAETWRRWGVQGLAPRAITVAGCRFYRVGEVRAWLQGQWKPEKETLAKGAGK